MFVLVKYNVSTGEAYYINTTDLTVISSLTSVNYRNKQFYPLIRSHRGWGNPYIGTSLGAPEAVLPCGAPIVLPNSTSVGAFNVRTRMKVIVDYMQSLRVATTGRAMLLDPSTGYFIGNNNAADPVTKVVNGTTVVASYTDVVDPLIRKVVSTLLNPN